MSRALSDEQVGMILRRLTVIRDRVAPAAVGRPPDSYAQGLADGMTMAYEHARAIIGDVIGEAPATLTTPAARPILRFRIGRCCGVYVGCCDGAVAGEQ